MFHSITIGDKNTFKHWHLVSPSRPVVSPPSPKTNYVDILGKSGSLDYTEALTNIPRYSDREGSWEFVVLNPGDVDKSLYAQPFESYNWVDLYSEILQYLHGRYFDHIVLEDDPEYEYRGRVWVNEWRSNASWSNIVLNYHLEPFKYKANKRSIVEFTQREIQHADNINIHLNRVPGLQPTQLHLHATTTDTDTSHITYGCRVAFANEELGVSTRFTFNYARSGIGSIAQYDLDNHINIAYADLDKDVAPIDCLVSNIYGGNCVLSFGCLDNAETMYGPLTIQYWWEEAIL